MLELRGSWSMKIIRQLLLGLENEWHKRDNELENNYHKVKPIDKIKQNTTNDSGKKDLKVVI